MSGLRPAISPRRGWGWVVGGGVVMALLATFPGLAGGIAGVTGWVVVRVVGLVWGLPYAPWIAGGLAAVAVGIAGWRVWKAWGW